MAVPYHDDNNGDPANSLLPLDFFAPGTQAVAPADPLAAMFAPRPVPHVAAAATPSMALYLTEPGTTTAISVADLHQDGLGDCFLISSIGELALTDPAAISAMIKANSNGTETVTLHVEANGKLPVPGYSGAFKSVTETVTNSFDPNAVNSAAGQDVINGVKEIWPQVIEKAVAELNGGYNAIAGGGYPFVAMDELTGVAATWLYLPQQALTLSALQGYIKAGDMLTFDTVAHPTGYNLVGGHSYMFEALNGSGSTATVTLGNPWGVDQPGAIPLSKLAGNIIQVDIGHHG
jgi:Calpain family cysteine protease